MEIGIDTFAAAQLSPDRQVVINSEKSIEELLERVVAADEMGLDIFGLGEHHRKEFLDSSPNLLLAAAAVKSKRIRLTSAVTVLSAHDPVRIFQDFATLDLLSKGRIEMVAGRGSFIDAFPLFGLELRDYDELFEEKLNLLLKIRKEPVISWTGKYRPPLYQQSIYPRPLQNPLPIWLGAGGTPESFIRAGRMGLPLMVAIIGGETHRFRPLVDLYREAGAKAGYSEDQLKIGLHSFGYVAENSQQAADDAFAGLSTNFQEIRKERGWPQMTREQFDYQCAPLGAYLIGSPDEVAEKILRHSEALGGISRVTFQMDGMQVGHEKLLQAIELIGGKIKSQIQG